MGEVYRAKDTRLERFVAIKVLPGHLSSNPDLRQRFEREAKAVSSLSHPNICTLYDIGNHDGIDFLVMEYVEGETLSSRLQKGPLSIPDVLRYSIQIAAALDKAHRNGIVHRDLKPGNIIVTKSGIKLLDFGLAKIVAPKPAADTSQLATEHGELTKEGTILGTLQYMAPEQLESRETDVRTDIFAFGTVMYEMATGKKAFEAGSQASLIAAILKDNPAPITRIQPLSPPILDRIISTCLQKDPEDRWQNAHDLMNELRWIAEQGTEATMAVSVPRIARNRERLFWCAAVVALLALGAVFYSMRLPAARPIPMRFSIDLTDKYSLRNVAISPDGSRIVFAAKDVYGKDQLWIREMNSSDLRALPGTEHPAHPFWSPDNRFVGFFADGMLKKINVSGGPPQIVCNAPMGRGASWNRENTILFCPNIASGLFRVSAFGGTPSAVTELAPGEITHRWPLFLPDGRQYLYFAAQIQKGESFIYAGSLDSKEKKKLIQDEGGMAYVSPGYLLYVRDENLLAQSFDAKEIKLAGEPFIVAEDLEYFAEIWCALFTVSENGILLYQARSPSSLSQLRWFDRTGKPMETLGPPGDQTNPRISPDGKRVALDMVDSKTANNDVWIYETTGGIPRRFTSDPDFDAHPVWSPEASRIAFVHLIDAEAEVDVKVLDGESKESHSAKHPGEILPTDWSPDGRFILSRVQEPNMSNSELRLIPTSGDQKPVALIKTNFSVSQGQFSPDGRWIAYVSNESGRWEIYVTPFPSAEVNWKVSNSGGTEPRWRRDGKELYYISLDGKLMAVQVKTEPTFEANIAQPLFQTYAREHISSTDSYSYDVSPDGGRFLINTQAGERTSVRPTVLLNWMPEPNR